MEGFRKLKVALGGAVKSHVLGCRVALYAVLKNHGFQRKYPPSTPLQSVPLVFYTLTAFLTYLSLQLFFIPFIARLILCGTSAVCVAEPDTLIFITDVGIVVSALVTLAFSLVPQYRQAIWGINEPLKIFPKGAAWWFFAFPLAMLLGAFVKLIIELFVEYQPSTQVAVQFLKDLHDDPVLFYANAFAIVFIIPVTEEILFRGFLLNYFKSIFSFPAALISSALFFACFHFNVDQGLSNIELLVALTTLGLILGWIYEREKSLWASIGLHSLFNFFGVLGILSGA